MMMLAGTLLHPLQTGTCRTEGRFLYGVELLLSPAMELGE